MKRLCLLCVVLAGCGSVPPVPGPSEGGKGGYYKDDGPADRIPADLGSVPDAIPKDEPLNPRANRPYRAFGTEYVPLSRVQPFHESGLASWYGRRYHGQKTSSGEVYDMFAMTAAHPTLPIPSYARVTSVVNGRSVIVRINDRGPFRSGRIIDLSYAAAFRLGIIGPGSGEVEVDSIVPGSVYLQLGVFNSRDNAESLRARVAHEATWLQQTVEVLPAGGLWRLSVGPYASREAAHSVAQRIASQLNLTPLVIVR